MNLWKTVALFLVAALVNFNAQAGDTLHFQAGKINTTGAFDLASQSLLHNQQSTEYFVVQFKNPITSADKQKLQQFGIQVLRYIPDDALLVQVPNAFIGDLEALAGVHKVVNYSPSLKLSQHFEIVDHMTSDLPEKVLVRTMTEEALSFVQQSIELNDLGQIQFAKDKVIGLITNRGQLSALSQVEGVEFIEPYPEFEFSEFKIQAELLMEATQRDISSLNGYESGTKVMNFDAAWSQGYDGQGQIVAFADTGLDSGDQNSIHKDFQGQVLKGYAYGLLSFSWNDPMGHGTHVAGSIASNGAASNGMLKGGAYKSQLIAGGMWSQLLGNMIPPQDITVMFKDAYNDGARLHTNSWGSPRNPGAYDSFAETVDKFMWEHPDMLILFAAGNSGDDANKDGRVDNDSIGSPATAKNVLAVGASENLVTEGGIQRKVGELKGQDGQPRYPKEPLASDYLSNNPDGIAVFSSRGPTDDGRVKPDVVAPGANVLSVRSQVEGANELWGAFNQDYTWSGGTSMSTPLVAGGAAVVRQYLAKEKGMNQPSAAMVKAVLMHSAKDLFPGQFGAVGKSKGQELLERRPNMHQGFGRVDMARATAMKNDILIDNTQGVAQGDFVTHTISIDEPTDLMVTLMYTDAPAAPSSGKALVNDLDLTIKGQGLNSKHQDRTNNFEYALLKNVKGQVEIQVQGFRIPQGRNGGALPYALVISAGKAESSDSGNSPIEEPPVEDPVDEEPEEEEEEGGKSLEDIIKEILEQLG